MALFTYSRSLVAKAAENIRDVQAMFGEIRDYLSGSPAPNLSGAQNFIPNTITSDKLASQTVDLSNLAADASPPGLAGSVVASFRQSYTWSVSAGVQVHTDTLNLSGQQPGDLWMIHRAFTIQAVTQFGTTSFATYYTDAGRSAYTIDSAGSETVPSRSLGWADFTLPGPQTSAFWLAPARSATGAQAQLVMFRDAGSSAATINTRLTAILLRMS